MNKIEIYQHPYVDVFKSFKVFELSKMCHWEGDVTESTQKNLGKVFKIIGTTTASNYIQIPGAKSSTKSLGLIGKEQFLILKSMPGKLFSVHLDYIVNDKNLCRVSFSNIYKEKKNIAGNAIQIPIELPISWTVLHIQGSKILSEAGAFSPSNTEKNFYLWGVQVCSNLWIKGLYTSDIAYTVATFPKECGLKVKPGDDWHKEYCWKVIPDD